MEIFQTIMTALTTPNEGLIKIISIPLTFLDAYIGMLFFTTILGIEATKKKKLTYVLSFSLIGLLINFLLPNLYATFLIMILCPTLIILIFKVSILKGILSEVLIYVATACLELSISKILFAFFHITTSEMVSIPLYRIAIVITVYLLMWLLAGAIKYFRVNIKVFDNMSKKSKILLITNLLLMILVIAMNYCLLNYYSDSMPAYITFISLLALIAYFVISIYSIINSSKLAITSRDLEGANLTIHSLRALHDTVRTFKHDFDNMVNSIGGYVRTKDMPGLTKYYEQLLLECNKTNNLYSLSPDVINHPAIYNILAAKYYDADELNILIHLDIFLDLNEIEQHMKIYEFTRILGILLDNSIEAAKQCEDKKINVIFRKEENKRRLTVIIENTYTNKDVDTDKIFDKGVSSKVDHENSGLGLWKVREILKKNNNLNLFTSKDEEFFKQQFEIYY